MKAWKNLLQTAAACLHYTHTLEAGQEKLSCGRLWKFYNVCNVYTVYVFIYAKKNDHDVWQGLVHTSRVRLGKSEPVEKDGERWRRRRERGALPEK